MVSWNLCKVGSPTSWSTVSRTSRCCQVPEGLKHPVCALITGGFSMKRPATKFELLTVSPWSIQPKMVSRTVRFPWSLTWLTAMTVTSKSVSEKYANLSRQSYNSQCHVIHLHPCTLWSLQAIVVRGWNVANTGSLSDLKSFNTCPLKHVLWTKGDLKVLMECPLAGLAHGVRDQMLSVDDLSTISCSMAPSWWITSDFRHQWGKKKRSMMCHQDCKVWHMLSEGILPIIRKASLPSATCVDHFVRLVNGVSSANSSQVSSPALVTSETSVLFSLAQWRQQLWLRSHSSNWRMSVSNQHSAMSLSVSQKKQGCSLFAVGMHSNFLTAASGIVTACRSVRMGAPSAEHGCSVHSTICLEVEKLFAVESDANLP